jgi:hypothetical protein
MYDSNLLSRESRNNTLPQVANAGILVSRPSETTSHGISFLNRLKQLELQKKELEQRQGIIFTDKNVPGGANPFPDGFDSRCVPPPFHGAPSDPTNQWLRPFCDTWHLSASSGAAGRKNSFEV